MANPIIQNYLNDTSIPKDKRQFAIEEMKKGVPEAKIAGAITDKYGDIYNPVDRSINGKELSVEEMQNSDFSYRSPIGPMPQAPAPQPQADASLGGRIKSALTGAYKTAKSGVNTMVGGMEDIKAPQRAKEQADYMIKQAKDQLARDGDQEKFNKKMEVINKMTGSAADRGKLGLSEIFKGTTQTATSPIVGGFEGALKPELEKLSQFISGGVEGMSDKNKARLQSAIDTLHSFTTKHPALTNYASGLFDLATVGAGSKVAKNAAKGVVKGAKIGTDIGLGVTEDLLGAGSKLISKAKGLTPDLGKIKMPNIVTKEKPALRALDSLAGVNEAEANAIKNFSKIDPKKMGQLISTAEKRVKGNLNISPTMEVANWTKEGVSKLSNLRNDLGKQIGEIKSSLSGKKFRVPMTSAKDNVLRFLNKDNVGVKLGKDGKLNFSGSIFETSKADQKFVEQILKDIGKDTPIDVVLRRLTRIGNELYQGKSTSAFTNSNMIDKLAEVVRKSYRKSIDDFATSTGNQKLIELNAKFSEISDALHKVEKTLGSDGIKSAQKIRQAFSNTGQPLQEFFGGLDEIGRKYNIPELHDILHAGDSAISIESALGTFSPTGIESVISKGVKGGILEKGKDLVIGSKLDAIKRIASRFNKDFAKQYKPKRKILKGAAIGGAGTAGYSAIK